jgi:phage-related protein
MKPVIFLGDTRNRFRDFPASVQLDAGRELERVQRGVDPIDWKPMPTIGKGVREIRVADRAGAFRVIYVASIGAHIYVLHAFQKKTQKTSKRDLDLAALRYKFVLGENHETRSV